MIREFFYLQKSDRKVILTLLLVIVIALGVIFIVGGESEEEVPQKDSLARTSNYYVAPKKTELFVFDPNTADSTQLLRLGLQPWQVRNIYKYRAAGGIYREKTDFARLYGLTVKQYRELEPYIRISDDYLPASTLLKHEKRSYRDVARDSTRQDHASALSNYHYQPKISAGETVVLNTADTTDLKTVPGIGPYYARKIIQYGERLGGYVSVDQLDEIEDFPSEAKSYLVIRDAHPQKLNVNKLSLNELKRHPYINFYQARAITDYRRLHGPIHSLQDLRLSKDFPPEAITRLEPYVEY
jgi:DNA uptake protein and related DNA-binding proteins